MSTSSDDLAESAAITDLRKGAWTGKEDAALSARVAKYGTKSWTIISAGVEGRSAKSCRLRWYNQLCPGVKRTPFSEWEQAVIIKAQKVHTNKWAALAKLLKGRTDNAIKNHWNATLSRRLNNPAENFKNQFIEQGVTLDWLLQHPELDTSNDLEEAMGNYHKPYPPVIKPLRKKRRRSTPDSPSYSRSPSPPPTNTKPKLRSSDHKALEVCGELGLSSDSAPKVEPHRGLSPPPPALAAPELTAAAPVKREVEGLMVEAPQQQSSGDGGYGGSSCHTPAAAAAGGSSPCARDQSCLGPSGQSCMVGPDGICCCQPGMWQQQQQHRGTVHLTGHDQYPQEDMHWQQQQQQRMFSEPSRSFYQLPPNSQDVHMQQGGCGNALAVPYAAEQQQLQQQSGSSISSGSPVGPSTGHVGLTPCYSGQLVSGAASGSTRGVFGSLVVPDRSFSSNDLQAAAACAAAADGGGGGSSMTIAGLPMDNMKHRPHMSAPYGQPAALSADIGNWGVFTGADYTGVTPGARPHGPGVTSHSGITPGPGVTRLPPSDCLGPLGMRPTARQGKLLSPAAYDMMVAGMSAGSEMVELQAMSHSHGYPPYAAHSSYCYEVRAPAYAGATGPGAGHPSSPRHDGSSFLAHARSMPPSLAPSGPRLGSSPDSQVAKGYSYQMQHRLSRSHSYTFGGFGGSSSSSCGPPPLSRSSSGGFGGCHPPPEHRYTAQWGNGYDCNHDSSYDGPYPGPRGPPGPGYSGLPCHGVMHPSSSSSSSYEMQGHMPPAPRYNSTPAPFHSRHQQHRYDGPSLHRGYSTNIPYINPSSSSRAVGSDCYGQATARPYPPAGFSDFGPRPDVKLEMQQPGDALAGIPACLLAEAPTTVLLQQQQQQAAEFRHQDQALKPQIQASRLPGTCQGPSLGSLRPDEPVVGSPLAWDGVGDSLSEVFADAGDAESLDWDKFEIPQLQTHEVEELLML